MAQPSAAGRGHQESSLKALLLPMVDVDVVDSLGLPLNFTRCTRQAIMVEECALEGRRGIALSDLFELVATRGGAKFDANSEGIPISPSTDKTPPHAEKSCNGSRKRLLAPQRPWCDYDT